jgi:KDO2-lipid IV(A) lauroyltransferase
LSVSNRARRNLRFALPGISEAEVRRIVRGMWDNLGRVIAEYPHLKAIAAPESGRVAWAGMGPVEALRDGEGAGIMASAHMANWEVLPVSAARNGIELTGVVREPNNPFVRPLIDRLRGVAGGRRAPKGSVGARQALAVLRGGGLLALLYDQKMNDGIAVPLFGVEAMTAAAPAQLALRFDCPLVPVRIERTGPGRFRVSAHPPVDLPDTGDRQADTAAVMSELNRILEEWIRARPEQWLWLHRRWPEVAYEARDGREA